MTLGKAGPLVTVERGEKGRKTEERRRGRERKRERERERAMRKQARYISKQATTCSLLPSLYLTRVSQSVD